MEKNRSTHIKAVLLSFDTIIEQPDAETTIRFLRSKNLRLGLISSKSPASIRRSLKNFKSIRAVDFETMVSNKAMHAHKPSITCIEAAIKNMNLAVDQVLAVSSRAADIRAGQTAGAVTAYLNNRSGNKNSKPDCDYRISNFNELKKLVRMSIPLPTGKLPNDLLREFLDDFIFDDPSILINPGVGEDTAAVDVQSEEVLVLKSDPITFATDSIGQYAVLINANDIATSGARPRWFLTTLLFPYGVTASEIRQVVGELKAFCRQWGITLCGGHTEITDAVSRPVVAGMMAGTVAKSDLIDKRNMGVGDRVLLTKGIAVEGTAIIAREFGDRLKKRAMTDTEIKKCCGFLSSISIISEAKIAARSEATSAMHDITEGGLATALEELSIAGNHRIRIEADKIPVFPETRKICRLLKINPLGLIGSGSLLICCRKAGCENLMAAIRKAGIQVACIGEVLEEGQGIEARTDRKRVDWPSFEADEITKLF